MQLYGEYVLNNIVDSRLKEVWADEYSNALKEHYPELTWTQATSSFLEEFPADYGTKFRYQKPTERGSSGVTGWISNRFSPANAVVSKTYKGLLCHKSPIDLFLYSACLWEVKPKTVIELGAFHGGSGLWLADQMECMNIDGEVHSYELLIKAVSPRAKHEKLHFHCADLKNLASFNIEHLKNLPHPWLIIDDAHVNVLNTLSFFREFMKDGDYFIKEDTCSLGSTVDNAEYLILAEGLGFVVDRIYADAFGYNVTTAKNTWFTLLPGCEKHIHASLALRDITFEGA